MKALLFVLACLLTAGAAFANDYVDNVGIYFDPEATDLCENRIESDAGIGVRHVYCVLTQLTNPSVQGFELALSNDGPLLMSNFAFPAGSGAINLLSAPTFLVGFAMPLPAIGAAVVVMEFDILVYSLDENLYDTSKDANVYLREIFFHSLEDPVPAYLNADGEILPLHQSTGLPTDPVMIFSLDAGGCGNVVAADETTWDAMKSLYR